MAPNTLILFTLNYPYGIGEEFIENEIEEASNHYAKIVIVPNETKGRKRSVPLNAEVRKWTDFDAKSDRPSLIKFAKLFFKELLLQRKEILFRIKSIKVSWNYYKEQFIKSFALNQLLGGFKHDESILLYDFWVTNNALAISLSKENFPDTKYIACTHNFDLYDFRWGCPIPFRGVSMFHADAIFPDSKYGVKYLKSKVPESLHHKIKLAYMGTPDFGISPVPENKVVTILSTSRCIPHKRIDWIIRAIADLENVKYKWIHFGDGEAQEELKKLASELLPKDSYTFFGWVDFDKLIKFYKETPIDIFIHMSTAEGLPVSLMIASSFGVPIVAIDSMGVPELINPTTGHLLSSDSTIKDVKFAIEEVLLNMSRSSELRLKAREYCLKNFSTDNYKEFYSKKLKF